MQVLDVRLLGPVRVAVDGRPLTIRSLKALGLLCYLCSARQVHARDRLAALLWPDVPDRNAQASLRTALYDLRRTLGAHAGEYVVTERTRVGLMPGAPLVVDTSAVEATSQMSAGPGADAAVLQAAVDAYAGPFLDGFSLPDAPDFDDWVFLERERLESLFVGALCRLGESHGSAGRYPEAVEALRRLLHCDPLREDVHRELMRLLALSGQRPAALAQYQACTDVLRRELDVPPLPATTELFERIRAGRPLGDQVTGPGPLLRAAAARAVPALDAAPGARSGLGAGGARARGRGIGRRLAGNRFRYRNPRDRGRRGRAGQDACSGGAPVPGRGGGDRPVRAVSRGHEHRALWADRRGAAPRHGRPRPARPGLAGRVAAGTGALVARARVVAAAGHGRATGRCA